MNTVTVTAHGAPGSLVRKAQHNPQIAVEFQVANSYLNGYNGQMLQRLVTRAVEARIEGAVEVAAILTTMRRQAEVASDYADKYQHPEEA